MEVVSHLPMHPSRATYQRPKGVLRKELQSPLRPILTLTLNHPHALRKSRKRTASVLMGVNPVPLIVKGKLSSSDLPTPDYPLFGTDLDISVKKKPAFLSPRENEFCCI